MRSFTPVRLNAEKLAMLVIAAQRDGDRAIDTLLKAIRSPLAEYFTRHLPADEADDLAQLALIRVARALPRIDADRASAFVATIAQNLLRTAQRRMARDAKRFTSNAVIDKIESALRADEEADQHDLVEAVRRVSVTALPRELREIVLALMRGQSHAEIAAKQGVRQVTVRTRLVRARAILREELRQYGPALDAPRASAVNPPPSATRSTPQNEPGDAEVWSFRGKHQRDHRDQE